MKRFIILSLMFTFFVFGCSKGGDEAGFKKGAPAYKLAQELTSILPLLDPEKNAVLISTNPFEVTTGFWWNSGSSEGGFVNIGIAKFPISTAVNSDGNLAIVIGDETSMHFTNLMSHISRITIKHLFISV